MKTLKWIKGALFSCAILMLGACNNDSEPMGKGEAEFEITDASIDDANIESVVVTIADIKVNGNSLPGFTKQTIDLKAYFDGSTKVLGKGEFDARTYENLVLVLDLDNDANGDSPGCYVLNQNNTKYKLKSTTTGTIEIPINKSWKVEKNTKTSMVMDFDLRKAIRYSDDPSVAYSFVSDNNLQAAIQVVAKAKTGTIKGSYQEDTNSNADKIIVYAYKKGTFNANIETQPQGVDNILFANARSSAEVKESLSGILYTLAFLEEGEYELHFAAYTRDTSTGRYHFEARLQSETDVDGSVGNLITVKSGVTINVSSTIKGII